jgi:hypothetical protein
MICLFSGNVRCVHVRKIMTQARRHDGTQIKRCNMTKLTPFSQCMHDACQMPRVCSHRGHRS